MTERGKKMEEEKMAGEQINVYSTPHWKMDPSLVNWPETKGSFSIPSRALNIVWGSDPRFWEWIKLTEEETRTMGFEEAALLQQVNWIEITGKLEIPSSRLAMHNTYTIYYVVKFLADSFGWDSAPVKSMVRINAQEIKSIELKFESYRKKANQWHEIPGGKFNIDVLENIETQITTVEFGMFEVETDLWKGGMILGGIKIKPDKNVRVIELK